MPPAMRGRRVTIEMRRPLGDVGAQGLGVDFGGRLSIWGRGAGVGRAIALEPAIA